MGESRTTETDGKVAVGLSSRPRVRKRWLLTERCQAGEQAT
jgi:hypothetical protein